MFGSIGSPEIIVIMLIALLLFGPKKLPEIGRTLGGAVRELKKAARDFTSSMEQIETEVKDEVSCLKDDVSSLDRD
jgi:sec-independent protein translocase protein TatA